MLLNENGLENIVGFNPFIAKPQDLLFAVSTVMFFVSRINQSNHIITEAQTLKGLLTQLYSPLSSSRYDWLSHCPCLMLSGILRSSSSSHLGHSAKSGSEKTSHVMSDILQRISYASINLAASLTSSRYFIRTEGNTFTFDPRFLIFEYVFDILLRKRQVEMVNSFLESISQGNSRVQQMVRVDFNACLDSWSYL